MSSEAQQFKCAAQCENFLTVETLPPPAPPPAPPHPPPAPQPKNQCDALSIEKNPPHETESGDRRSGTPKPPHNNFNIFAFLLKKGLVAKRTLGLNQNEPLNNTGTKKC
jgi:hypothetical protein